MIFDLWHGSHSYFAAFDDNHIGTGEGSGMGWGHHLAEHRPGGEYFASYMHHREKQGYLYRAEVVIQEDEILNLDDGFRENAPHIRRRISRLFTLGELKYGLQSAYGTLRRELGDEQASKQLLAEGVIALRAYEETKPAHGDTILVLDPSRIRIKEAYELRIMPQERSWLPLGVSGAI